MSYDPKTKEAFQHAVHDAILHAEWYKKLPPGEVVKRLRETFGDALTRLTSKEASDVRDDEIRTWIEPVPLWERIRRQR